MRFSSILGLNSRTTLFSYKYNTRQARKFADSKIQTARILKKANVPAPLVIFKFNNPLDINKFDWETLPNSFALKPSRGLGGEGIIVVKKRDPLNRDLFITTQRRKINISDLKIHILDILEGAYSMGNVPDVAFIQEYVGRHKVFRKYAYRGTPDIRVIVFKKVPVMAMLRLPTKESGGRANLHQGAIAVGIDITTGITTRALWHGEYIRYKPDTKRKLHGIKIPFWDKVLETAVRAQIASGLGYLGVDIVLHPEKGPMVLELNAQPGLQIQLANRAGLRRRLDKIEDLTITSAEQGVRISKALFAERFADRVKAEEGIKTINVWELVKVVSGNREKVEVVAKIDTGAWRTSIDKTLAEKLGLTRKENILWTKKVKSGLGSEVRYVINLRYYLAGRKIKTIASLSKRSHLRSQLIIGRRDLAGYLVKSDEKDVKSLDWYKKLWTKH